MPIRDELQRIAVGWPSYQEKGRVNKTSPVYSLVAKHFLETIRLHLPEYGRLKFKGSTGAGYVTAAPWMAVFDPRLTDSATTGYYVVYLFSVDMKTVTLCLAFGTTQFENQFGGPTNAFPRMREAASRLQDLFRPLVPATLSRNPIQLGATYREKLHSAYEQSAIFSYPPYLIENLPAEERLVSDLREIVQIYTKIVSDPLTPDLDLVVQTAIVAPKTVTRIEVKEFSVRPARQKVSPRASPGLRRRYSLESRKVGDAGERAVIRYEREKLVAAGRKEFVDLVRWHSEAGEYPGWDITSFDEDGQEIYIEVKSSVGKSISCIDITVNEWLAASSEHNRGRYFVYIVTNALSENPTIEMMRDPFGFVSRNELRLHPIVYELQLFEK
jgi:hypothetical protein